MAHWKGAGDVPRPTAADLRLTGRRALLTIASESVRRRSAHLVHRTADGAICRALPIKGSKGEHDADAGPLAYDRRGAGLLLVAIPNHTLCHSWCAPQNTEADYLIEHCSIVP